MGNINKSRDIRLMKFTATLKSLDVVSTARVEQCYHHWLNFENQYTENLSISEDYRNMLKFIKKEFDL